MFNEGNIFNEGNMFDEGNMFNERNMFDEGNMFNARSRTNNKIGKTVNYTGRLLAELCHQCHPPPIKCNEKKKIPFLHSCVTL